MQAVSPGWQTLASPNSTPQMTHRVSIPPSYTQSTSVVQRSPGMRPSPHSVQPYAAERGISATAVRRSVSLQAETPQELGLGEPALGGSYASGSQIGSVSARPSGPGAPSAALLAAVQAAAAGRITDTAPLPGRRRRWATMTEEELNAAVPPGVAAAQAIGYGPSPSASPCLMASQVPGRPPVAMQPAMTSPAMHPGRSPGMNPHPAARRRWASISDDEGMSPMMWPMAHGPMSPLRGAIHRSQNNTPMMGPGTHVAAQVSGLNPNAAEWNLPFMLPQAQAAQAGMPMPMLDPGSAPGYWNGFLGGGLPWGYPGMPAPHPGFLPSTGVQHFVPHTSLGPAMHQVPSHGAQAMPSSALCGPRPCLAHDPMQGFPAELLGRPRPPGGWTAIWVGERAFRAPAIMKEQMEAAGFLVKIYRSHEKCSRALDKKPHIAPTNMFVVAEADAAEMLQYLQGRGAAEMQLVVDAEGADLDRAAELRERLACPEDICMVTVATSWVEVLQTLCNASAEDPLRAAASGGVCLATSGACGAASAPQQAFELQGACGGVEEAWHGGACGGACGVFHDGMEEQQEDAEARAGQCGNPWTLVWISDQAFKPAAVNLKMRLESMGCQVKGYKTQKNAARALDKKRALVRTVVLVSGAEAPAFLAYLAARPELTSCQVVVESSSRTAPVREGPTCRVVESFEDAMMAVQQVALAPGFA